jgi:hypothetical protein
MSDQLHDPASLPLYTFDRLLCGPQIRSGSCGEDKNKIPSCSSRGINPGRPARSLVLYWLSYCTYNTRTSRSMSCAKTVFGTKVYSGQKIMNYIYPFLYFGQLKLRRITVSYQQGWYAQTCTIPTCSKHHRRPLRQECEILSPLFHHYFNLKHTSVSVW